MSLSPLEREILAQLKVIVKNSKLREKDLLEWSTGGIKAQEGEVLVRLPSLSINVCIPKNQDKRK